MTNKETKKEYVDRIVSQSKDCYKEPENMIDEQIELLNRCKSLYKEDKEKLWLLAVAVSEAYHLIIWVDEKERKERLINTIISFIGD